MESDWVKKSSRNYFVIGGLLIAVLIGMLFIRDGQTRTGLEISLVSALTLGPTNMDFLILNPVTGLRTDVTGSCYRTEVQIKNSGNRQIAFPYSARLSWKSKRLIQHCGRPTAKERSRSRIIQSVRALQRRRSP
jgi:hypothetical protein